MDAINLETYQLQIMYIVMVIMDVIILMAILKENMFMYGEIEVHIIHILLQIMILNVLEHIHVIIQKLKLLIM